VARYVLVVGLLLVIVAFRDHLVRARLSTWILSQTLFMFG
jgi:hypothetical protein